jgi:hypothetical protein
MTGPKTGTEPIMGRTIRQFPHLGPADTSAEAFVKWMQANGGTGKHLHGDLYDAYRLLCQPFGEVPLSDKRFGKALQKLGCVRKKLDFYEGGVRRKPYQFTIPEGNETPSPEVEMGLKLMGWEASKGPVRKRTARVKRAEMKGKCVA